MPASQYGLIGVSTIWGEFDDPTSNADGPPLHGLIRELEPNAVFLDVDEADQARKTVHKLIWDGPIEHQGETSASQRFHLAIPVPQAEFRSFEDLIGRLTINPKAKKPVANQDLDRFDKIAAALIKWVERLHREKKNVGLLAPANIWFYESNDKLVVVPLDWGFGYGGFGTKPKWCADDSGRSWWGESPEDMLQGFRPERDWLTVSSIFRWAIEKSGRHIDVNHPTIIALDDMRRATPPTPSELLKKLTQKNDANSRLSDYFYVAQSDEPVKTGPEPPISWRPLLGVGALLIVALLVLFWFWNRSSDSNRLCPDCPKNSPVYPLLEGFEGSNDPKKYALLGEMWQTHLASTGNRQEVERRCLDRLLPYVLPEQGCPPGSPRFELLEQFKSRLQARQENPKEYFGSVALAELVQLLETIKNAPRSPIPAVAQREDELLTAAVPLLHPLFAETGVEFFRAYAGQLPADRQAEVKKLLNAWQRYETLAPGKAVRPWSNKLERELP